MVAMPESEAPRWSAAATPPGTRRGWRDAGAECPPEGVTMGEALEGPGKPLSVSFESH